MGCHVDCWPLIPYLYYPWYGPNNVLTLNCLNRVASIEQRTMEEHLWNSNLQKRTRLQRFSAPKRVQNFDKIAQPQKGQFFQIWCKAIYNRSRYHLKSCVNTQGQGRYVLKIWMGNSIAKIDALLMSWKIFHKKNNMYQGLLSIKVRKSQKQITYLVLISSK